MARKAKSAAAPAKKRAPAAAAPERRTARQEAQPTGTGDSNRLLREAAWSRMFGRTDAKNPFSR